MPESIHQPVDYGPQDNDAAPLGPNDSLDTK